MQAKIERLAAAALQAVARAARVSRAVQSQINVAQWSKDDLSPVTVADLAVQALISRALHDISPEIPLVGEEGSEELLRPEFAPLLQQVVACLAAVESPNESLASSPEEVVKWIARGQQPVAETGLRWVLDPIDGTKGFLRKQQYAIALALLDGGEILAGVLACPNLGRVNTDLPQPNDPAPFGQVFVALRDKGAQAADLTIDGGHGPFRPITVSKTADPAAAAWVERVETSDRNKDVTIQIVEAAGITAAPTRVDSQAKYAVVAVGDAALYLRHTMNPMYRECVWDHAAGVIVIEEAGGRVTDLRGRKLDFTCGRRLERNRGIVASNGHLHDALLQSVRQVLGEIPD